MPVQSGDIILALAASVFLVATTWAPRDVDLYWHRVVGNTLLQSWWHADAADPIAYSPARNWYPSEWLFSVSSAKLIDVWGYGAVLVLRFMLCFVFAIALAAALRWKRPPWVAAVVFCCTALPMYGYMQDRAQTLSFTLLIPVAIMLRNGLRGSPGPHWWWLALYTWAWANLHGYWVFVPLACVLLGLAVVADDGHDGVHAAVRWFGRALACTVAASLTPFLWHTVLITLRASSNPPQIGEWLPPTLSLVVSWAPLLLLGILVVGWARTADKVPRGTVLVVLMLAMFAAMSERNPSTAAILLAPLAADALAGWRVPSSVQMGVPLWIPVGLLVVGVTIAVGTYIKLPSVPSQFPTAITQRLNQTTVPLRVLTDYNTSGFVRDFGGPDIRVAIDGRGVRYGATTVQRYLDMVAAKPGWRSTLGSYAPQVVVLDRADVLTEWLERVLHWRVAMRDGDYVMLLPPHSSLESTLS